MHKADENHGEPVEFDGNTYKIQPDRSTLDAEYIKAHWKPYRPGPTRHIDQHEGSGCIGDAPGFPSYFIRHAYTDHGNTPPEIRRAGFSGAVIVIDGQAYHVPEAPDPVPYSNRAWNAARDAVLARAWKPLPLEHPRVKAWFADQARHLRHCYVDETGKSKAHDRTDSGSDIVIYPVPNYELHHFVDDPRFSQDWRDKERAAVDAWNADLAQRRAGVATYENHAAIRSLKQFYPGAEITEEIKRTLANPPGITANWWERLPERPTPENCPGNDGLGPHPVNGAWCQCCGWSAHGKTA
jgi:hypothetical protein